MLFLRKEKLYLYELSCFRLRAFRQFSSYQPRWSALKYACNSLYVILLYFVCLLVIQFLFVFTVLTLHPIRAAVRSDEAEPVTDSLRTLAIDQLVVTRTRPAENIRSLLMCVSVVTQWQRATRRAIRQVDKKRKSKSENAYGEAPAPCKNYFLVLLGRIVIFCSVGRPVPTVLQAATKWGSRNKSGQKTYKKIVFNPGKITSF